MLTHEFTKLSKNATWQFFIYELSYLSYLSLLHRETDLKHRNEQ